MTPPHRKQAFTLIEVLVSVTILTMVMALVWGSYYNVIQASRKGEVLLDQINQSDFVVDQILDSLRAAAFFPSNPEDFEFWHEDDESKYPTDMISWVTSSSAFMPPRSDLAHGLHRVVLTIEEDENGESGLAVAAWSHMQDPEDDDFEEVEPWIISRRIKGLDCKIYNDTLKEWEDEWEKKNTLPQFLMLTLTIDPLSESGEVYERTVSVQIPLGTLARSKGRFNQPGNNAQGTGDPNNPEAGGGVPAQGNNGTIINMPGGNSSSNGRGNNGRNNGPNGGRNDGRNNGRNEGRGDGRNNGFGNGQGSPFGNRGAPGSNNRPAPGRGQ